jgi:2-methylcitrate dehydratase PrpD
MFGTMTKSFHPGRAAQNGLAAALFAAAGYTASDHAVEAKRGWANVLSAEQHYDAVSEGLGAQYEILRNSYKPFACGLVVHAVIDGCIRLRNAHALAPGAIEHVALAVNPVVLELTAKRTPQTGLEGKFSVYHAAAIALVAGAAGEAQFSDAAVRDPTTIAVRERVATEIDPAIHKDQARVAITLKNGARHECFVEHAVGSVEVPMSDAQLEAKFAGLADGILPAPQIRRLIDLCWRVESLDDAGEIARAAARQGG